MMLKKVRSNKPILEYLVHYERMAGFALQYNWDAVKRYHEWIAEEVQEGERRWDSPIEVVDSIRFLKHEASILDGADSGETDREQGEPRDAERGRPPKRDKPRFQQFREYRSESEGSRPRGICRLFNWDRGGCTYGRWCQFHHHCALCKRMGITGIAVEHRAMDCSLQRGMFQGPPVNQLAAAPAHNGQAGGAGGGGR